MRDLNHMAACVHRANQKWWHDLETGKPIVRNEREMLMLMVSEVAEAMEGERKGLQDDHLPHRPMAEVEMADLVIRALDFAGGFGFDLPNFELSPDVRVPENRGEALLQVVSAITAIGDQIHDFSTTSVYLAGLISGAERYCIEHGYNLWGAVDEKLAYNAVRADHQPENRKKVGGKKW